MEFDSGQISFFQISMEFVATYILCIPLDWRKRNTEKVGDIQKQKKKNIYMCVYVFICVDVQSIILLNKLFYRLIWNVQPKNM